MKKEAVNLFNQGLNMDLNTIVVPNNILTDNLNGTFLTYNGDELSLQNDAGNTRIPIKDTIESVKLSEGFYPLGMKEYGGVLYIVSAKKGVDQDGLPKPELDEIEIGSYPSPELASYTTFHGQLDTTLIYPNQTNTNIFYKSLVINRDYFKTGRYISFICKDNPAPDMSNVWTYWDHKGLYIIKLYLQLDNGLIDLTDDIWDAFIEYKQENPSDTSLHWLLSKDFIYFCPYSYKGRLVVEVVISEPVFEPIKYYDFIVGNGIYTFKLDIRVENTEALQIIGYNIDIKTDVEEFDGDSDTTVKTYRLTIPQSGIISISENVDSKNRMMHYTITPIFKYINTNEELDWSSFPDEFKSKYTIANYVLLNEKYNNVGFSAQESECIPSEGKRAIKAVALIGESGYINTNLEQELLNNLPYVFCRWDYTPPQDTYNVLGTYEVSDRGLPISIDTNDELFSDTFIRDSITNKLQTFPVLVSDPFCSQSVIKLEFSAPLEMESSKKIKNGSLTIYQDNAATMLPYESTDGKTFKVYIDSTKSVDINFSHPSFNNVRFTILKENLNFTDSYKIGLILELVPTYVDEDVTMITELMFRTPDLEPVIDELGDYIDSLFDSNLPNRVQIVKTDPQATFEISENRMYFVKESGFSHFDMIITGTDLVVYGRTSIRYGYKIINAQPVLEGEYRNIRPQSNISYVKLGSNDLGYILFRESSQFNPIRLSGTYINSRTSDTTYNASGRRSSGTR